MNLKTGPEKISEREEEVGNWLGQVLMLKKDCKNFYRTERGNKNGKELLREVLKIVATAKAMAYGNNPPPDEEI